MAVNKLLTSQAEIGCGHDADCEWSLMILSFVAFTVLRLPTGSKRGCFAVMRRSEVR
jgi:hypothetical protein